MCSTCGCSEHAEPKITDLRGPAQFSETHSHEGHDHEHHHRNDASHHHGAAHTHPPEATRTIILEREVLAKNNRLAENNRAWFEQRGITAVNLMSSPGAGKTTLLERTIRDHGAAVQISVIEGDQETTRDAERIRAAGCPVVQVNTGSGCHLDSSMIAAALRKLGPGNGSMVMIENVGNLVCPALFDLGESARAIITAVTEGEDKPLKYPQMFLAADLIILNKIDLLPYVPFDLGRFLEYASRVNPRAQVLQLSATRGDGLEAWYFWTREQAALSRS